MRGRLDWIIARLYRGDAAALETPVPNILRTGLYQLLFTDRIPPFAAVNEAVGIAKKSCPAAAGLVNAILRNALREKENIAWPDMAKDPARPSPSSTPTPAGSSSAGSTSTASTKPSPSAGTNNPIPPLAVRVNSLKASREQAIAALAAEKIAAEKTRLLPRRHLPHLPRRRPPGDGGLPGRPDPGPGRGLPARRPSRRPAARRKGPRPLRRHGGKNASPGRPHGKPGEITAVDLHPDKLRLLAAEAGRLGVTIVETRDGDAAAPPETFRGAFDRVLLDAPCSGLGTLRRNPEIRWRIAPADLEKMLQLQKRLLGKRRGLRETGRPPGLQRLHRDPGRKRDRSSPISWPRSRISSASPGRDSPRS